MRHILTLDIGNTETKGALFEPRNPKAIHFAKGVLGEVIVNLLAHTHLPRVIMSNVTHLDPFAYLPKDIPVLNFDYTTPLPFNNRYKSPDTLGLDRIANTAGAAYLFPGQNALAIDFGTCIKYDFITDERDYLGGSISPGMQMRYKSLHAFTDKLPEVTRVEIWPEFGNDTVSSIQSGVQQGIAHEVEGFIAQYERQYGKINVIFTGGDALYFAPRFKNRIFAAPLLTLVGLAGILTFNE
jgi:type III pantothenate kinase